MFPPQNLELTGFKGRKNLFIDEATEHRIKYLVDVNSSRPIKPDGGVVYWFTGKNPGGEWFITIETNIRIVYCHGLIIRQ